MKSSCGNFWLCMACQWVCSSVMLYSSEIAALSRCATLIHSVSSGSLPASTLMW